MAVLSRNFMISRRISSGSSSRHLMVVVLVDNRIHKRKWKRRDEAERWSRKNGIYTEGEAKKWEGPLSAYKPWNPIHNRKEHHTPRRHC